MRHKFGKIAIFVNAIQKGKVKVKLTLHLMNLLRKRKKRKKCKIFRGIEPRSTGSKASMLTITLREPLAVYCKTSHLYPSHYGKLLCN